MPADALHAEEALRLADERMYALKHSHRVSAERQSTDVLLQVLTERHPDLGDNADGVAELARATGRQLGLSADALDQIELASRLHDIGKAAVPGEILTKPGPLTAEEWDLIRRHPVIGERILRAAPALARVAGVVRSSHERFDGTGYPDRLAGEQIPVGARVVAVCDAFDAIISERPYATRRTPSQAAGEVRRCAGTQFDPAVVDAFLMVFDARAAFPTQAGNAAPPLLARRTPQT